MKEQIMQQVNGWTYRRIKPKKVDVKYDILEFKRKWNLKLLNEGKNNFIK